MKPTLSLLALSMVLFVAPRPVAAQDEVDRKAMKRLLQEIELMPSLYAKGEKPLTVKTAPKFSALKLVSLPIGKINTAEKELENWKKDKARYGKDYPHRAYIFKAAELVEKVKVPMTFDPREPKAKAVFLMDQASLGVTVFKLEEILTQMNETDRGKETMRRWLLNADFARSRLLGDLLFLYEYNFALGQIRADALPDLGKDDVGWKIGFSPKINVTEPKAKVYFKERAALLKKIQEEYPDTPWAYFAERDGRRELGMQWVPRK